MRLLQLARRKPGAPDLEPGQPLVAGAAEGADDGGRGNQQPLHDLIRVPPGELDPARLA